jgi:hypothetical protein
MLGASPRDALVQLERAESLWQAKSPTTYSLTVRYSEFVGRFGCFSQTYFVSGARASGVAPLDCKYRPDKLGTVPALFRLMRETLRDNWDEVTVEFDKTYGYPKNFYAGAKDMEDAYFSFDVLNFEVTPNKRLERP